MPPIKEVVKEEKSVTVAPSKEVSTAVDFASEAGTGLENIAGGDMSMPYLQIVDAKSPEVDEGSERYIKGATAGMMFNSVTRELFDTRKTKGGFVEVIVGGFLKRWVEWIPRKAGGGFVKAHETDEILKQTTKGGPNMTTDVLPNGNEVYFTHYYFCLLVKPDGSESPVVLAAKSTQLKHCRKWLTLLKSEVMEAANGSKFNAPIFSRKWKISTTPEVKNGNTWFVFKAEPGELVASKETFGAAKALNITVNSGLALPAPETEAPTEANEETDAY